MNIFKDGLSEHFEDWIGSSALLPIQKRNKRWEKRMRDEEREREREIFANTNL